MKIKTMIVELDEEDREALLTAWSLMEQLVTEADRAGSASPINRRGLDILSEITR